jgi:hypothetical protein
MSLSKKLRSSLILGISISATLASSYTLAGVEYPSLHNQSAAESSYNSFLSGGDDPFEELGSGYIEGYLSEVESIIEPYSKMYRDDRYTEQSSTNNSFVKSLREQRKTEKSEIYQSSFDSNGNFDAELYASSYSDMLDSERIKSSDYANESLVNMVTAMSGSNSDLVNLSANVTSNSENATTNLIDQIKSRSYRIKKNAHDDLIYSLGRVSAMSSQAGSALLIASSFEDDCGDACAFPVLPPYVEPEIDPIDEPAPTPSPSPSPTNPKYDCMTDVFKWKDSEPYLFKCP